MNTTDDVAEKSWYQQHKDKIHTATIIVVGFSALAVLFKFFMHNFCSCRYDRRDRW